MSRTLIGPVSVSFLLIALAFSAPSAKAREISIMGYGSASCGTWAQERRAGSTWIVAANWVFGYLTAVSNEGKYDLLVNVDTAGVLAWLDKYCADHPLDKLHVASDTLAAELIRKAQAR